MTDEMLNEYLNITVEIQMIIIILYWKSKNGALVLSINKTLHL